MNLARILLSAAILAAAPAARAEPHSWYPMECYSNHDCMAADGIVKDSNGDRIVVVGDRRIWIASGFAARPSHDNQIRICFREGEYDFKAHCLFLPGKAE